MQRSGVKRWNVSYVQLPKSNCVLASDAIQISEITDPGGFSFSSTLFSPLLPENLLLPQEGELSYCVWTLNPANAQLHSSGYWLTRSRSKKPAKRHSQALRKMYRSRHGLQRSAKSPGGCCVCNQWYSTQAQRHLVREYLYYALICLPLGLNTDGSLIKPN